MTTNAEMKMNTPSLGWRFVNWFFAVVVVAIGTVNIFWGNDPEFGVFLVILSCVYFPPLSDLFKEKIGLRVPSVVKFFLGVFILWSALGVGELFDKVELMLSSI